MTHILRACRIGKSINGKNILNDLSLQINAGEVVCLLGESGCGKTTLLRCLNLLDYIDYGYIEYGGHRVIEGPPSPTATGPNGQTANGNGNGNGIATGNGNGKDAPPARRRRTRPVVHVNENHFRRNFGVVFPSGNLQPSRTVLENVIEGPVYVLGQSRKDVTPLAMEWLHAVQMTDHKSSYPSDLTVGERRQVALARALAMKPEVLLIDEITSGLYPSEAARILEIITNVRSCHNAATVMVTHHLAFAQAVANKVCFMDQGAIAEQGPPERLLVQPATDCLRTFLASVRAAA